MEKSNHPDDPKLPASVIALNYFSVLFLISAVSASIFLGSSSLSQLSIFFAWVYLVPPALCRVTIAVYGKPSGIVAQGSRDHKLWWLLMQYQLIFNRFTFLEDCLKTVPGLYAIWLNLWGAKISPFVFWAPGVTVMDRYHLQIEKGVILGTQCLISAHAVKLRDDGYTLLAVDPIKIDTGALIGARSIISPGCHIHAFESVAAQKLLKPYTIIQDGQKKQQLSNKVLYQEKT